MHTLALSAEEAFVWAALISAVVTSLAGAAISIIAALKGQKAEAKADTLGDRVTSQAASIRQLREQMTLVALHTPPNGGNVPAATGNRAAGPPSSE